MLFIKLKRIGIQKSMFDMLKTIYRKITNEVVTDEGTRNVFETKRGVRQGSPLSATLFNTLFAINLQLISQLLFLIIILYLP